MGLHLFSSHREIVVGRASWVFGNFKLRFQTKALSFLVGGTFYVVSFECVDRVDFSNHNLAIYIDSVCTTHKAALYLWAEKESSHKKYNYNSHIQTIPEKIKLIPTMISKSLIGEYKYMNFGV